MNSEFFQPISGFELPRFSGVPTFMRLPHVGMDDEKLKDVHIGLIGTPEIGGPNSFEAIQVVRKLEGLNFAGADLVEVSPPFDGSGDFRRPLLSLFFSSGDDINVVSTSSF